MNSNPLKRHVPNSSLNPAIGIAAWIAWIKQIWRGLRCKLKTPHTTV
ncbi:hypothetical protein [Commensalibacter sp. Nvir]